MRRRKGTVTKRVSMILSLVIAVPLLTGLLLIVLINPDSHKPDLVAALENATGRKVTIGGPIGIGFGFSPTFTLRDIHIANPPGFSRDDIAVIGSMEADISLLSLLSGPIHVSRLDILDANVLIETNPIGQVNTIFVPGARSQASLGAPAPTVAPAKAASAEAGNLSALDKVQIDQIGIFSGKFGTRDDKAKVRHDLVVNRTVLRTVGTSQKLNAAGEIVYDNIPVTFTLDTGALRRLLGQDVGPRDWPVSSRAQSGNSVISVSGTLSNPLAGTGYKLAVEAAIENLADMSSLLGTKLPPVHDVRMTMNLADRDGVLSFSSVLLRSGTSDLSDYADGLSVDHLVVTAPAMDQPIHGDLVGRFSNQPLQVSLDLGAPQSLVTAALRGSASKVVADSPLPISVDAQIAGARLTVKGRVAHPTALSGLDAAINMQIPDLTVFSVLVGRKLPALSNLTFTTQLTDGPDGLARGVTLRKIGFDGSLGDLAGDLNVGFRPRVAVLGNLSGKRLDLDALQVASDRAAANASTGSTPPAPAQQTAQSRYMLPETNIDFSGLFGFDADLKLEMGEIRSGGVPYRDVAGHVALANGRLSVDPFVATLPGGKLAFSLTVEPLELPPAVSMTLYAPGLVLKPLLTAFHQPDDVTGTLEVGMDLKASGRSVHALAASMTGKLGMAMVDAELDNRILGATLSQVLRAARLPVDMLSNNSASSRTKLRCVALRVDAVRGLATISDMAVLSAAAQVAGSGTVNFSDEMVSLRVRPALRSGVGPSVVVPVRVTGALAAPLMSLDSNSVMQGLASSMRSAATEGVANMVRQPVTTLGAMASDNDPCPPALAAARAAQPSLN